MEIPHVKVNLSQFYEDIKCYFKIITVPFSLSLHGPWILIKFVEMSINELTIR